MRTYNRLKEYKLYDLYMYISAAKDIAEMLSLMGLAEGDPFHLHQKVLDNHSSNYATDIAYFRDGDNIIISHLHADGTSVSCYQYGCGELLCSIQAELGKEFRKYVRTTNALPRKYLTKFRNLKYEFDCGKNEIERNVAGDIIQMCHEMGKEPGEYQSLPEVKRPKNHSDRICAVTYQRGKARAGGMTYDYYGEESHIGYRYYDVGGINYGETCGIESILPLYRRVARLYRKYKKDEKEDHAT